MIRAGRYGLAALGALVASIVSAGTAWADRPVPWQMWFQEPATPVADRVQELHLIVTYIITAIVIFVMGLLLWVIVRYRASVNPVPGKFSHNTVVEIAWTLIPIVILATISVPSLRLIYFQERLPGKADLTLKVTGVQWYWHYAYPDYGDLAFDSNLITEETKKKLTDPSLRLLDVDNEVVLPINKNIRVQIAGQDVMHSWFVPSLAVQKYAVVGHLNEVWMNIEREGTYYGECNQICGVNHAFMPIKIHAVSPEAFDKWVADAKQRFAANDGGPATSLAALATTTP